MGGKGPCGRHTGWLWMLALHPNNHPISPCKESKPHREKGVSPELFRPYQTRNEAEHPRNCQGKEEVLQEGCSLPDVRREEKAPNLAPPALPPASSKELAQGSVSSLALTLELPCQVNLNTVQQEYCVLRQHKLA